MASINERIKQVRFAYCEGNNDKFAQQLGRSTAVTSNWVREGYSVGRGVASLIADTFGIDVNWLLKGEGEGPLIIQRIGDGSSNNTQVAGASDVAVLEERIRGLEKILEEKERTIQILMGKK